MRKYKRQKYIDNKKKNLSFYPLSYNEHSKMISYLYGIWKLRTKLLDLWSVLMTKRIVCFFHLYHYLAFFIKIVISHYPTYSPWRIAEGSKNEISFGSLLWFLSPLYLDLEWKLFRSKNYFCSWKTKLE